MLNEVVNFNEKFKEAAILEHERLHANMAKDEESTMKEYEGNEAYITIFLLEFGETEAIVTALEGFKETTENKISNFEGVINAEITKDWKDTESRIVQEEHARNRDIIEEIV